MVPSPFNYWSLLRKETTNYTSTIKGVPFFHPKGWCIDTLKRNLLAPLWRCWYIYIYTPEDFHIDPKKMGTLGISGDSGGFGKPSPHRTGHRFPRSQCQWDGWHVDPLPLGGVYLLRFMEVVCFWETTSKKLSQMANLWTFGDYVFSRKKIQF